MADIYETIDNGTFPYPDYSMRIGDRFFGRLDDRMVDDNEGDGSDTIAFDVLAGNSISFFAEYIANIDALFDVGVTVRDENGDLVRNAAGSARLNGAEVTFATAGTYYARVKVGDADESGDYRFDLSYAETVDPISYLTPLTNNLGDVSALGETDTLNFNVVAGVTYRITLSGEDGVYDPITDESSPTLTNGTLTLKDEDANLIAQTQNGALGADRVLTFTADTAETLTLDIKSATSDDIETSTGAYAVDIARIDLIDGLINGTDLDNDLDGTSGADAIKGLAGNDTINAEQGNDLIFGGTGKDRVFDGRGNDFVSLGDGNDYVRVGGGADEYAGGAGKDYISYYDSRNGVTLDLGANTATGSWANNDTIKDFESASGSKTGDDRMTGTSGANTFKTYGGNDKVYAGRGNDKVSLGSGNDYVRVGGGSESFDGGSGRDYISYYDSRNGVTIDLDANTVIGSWANNDNVANFEGVSGSKSGNDILLGTGGYNKMRGYGGDDVLDGRGGNDKLYGGTGDDTIIGGAGRDEMYGGSGADVFIFDIATATSSYDKIMDFEAGVDTVRLIGFGFDEMTDLSRYSENPDGRVNLDFEVQGISFEGITSFATIMDSFEFG